MFQLAYNYVPLKPTHAYNVQIPELSSKIDIVLSYHPLSKLANDTAICIGKYIRYFSFSCKLPSFSTFRLLQSTYFIQYVCTLGYDDFLKIFSSTDFISLILGSFNGPLHRNFKMLSYFCHAV